MVYKIVKNDLFYYLATVLGWTSSNSPDETQLSDLGSRMSDAIFEVRKCAILQHFFDSTTFIG